MLMLFMLVVILYVDLRACHEGGIRMEIFVVFTWLYAAMGTIFLFSGVLMGCSVRKFYPEFYQEYGKYIWIVTILLALPLYYRAIDNSSIHGTRYIKYYFHHFAFVNCTYIILSSILPVIT